MTAYDVTEWSEFFLGSAGASAALAGLVFVAVSINIQRILNIEGVADFAMVALLMLIGVLLVSLLGLIPGQKVSTLGWEMIAGGIMWGSLTGGRLFRSIPREGDDKYLFSRLLLPVAGTLPLVVGAISLVAGAGGGLYWVAAGIVTTIFAAVVNAWIILVEILR